MKELQVFYFEHQMQSPILRGLINGLIGLAIYVTGEVGQLFGIKMLALPVSVIWPPTGVALAAFLLFGFRAWPGIFLGNYLYNFLQLSPVSVQIAGPLITAIAISLGSTAEILVAGLVIKRFSSPGLFYSLRDILIFLIPGSLLPALIASSVGVTSLYLLGILPTKDIVITWITFSSGDVGGIYAFTPLIVVWATQVPTVKISDHPGETALMGVAFICFSLFYLENVPLFALPLPLSLWIAYRYRIHGATLAIIMICLTTLIPTSLGIGATTGYLLKDEVVILVSLLQMTAASSLILAAFMNEREAAERILQLHNMNLQDAVNMQYQKLKEMHAQVFVKQKLASIGTMTVGIAKHIVTPIRNIERTLMVCKTLLFRLTRLFREHQEQWNAQAAADLNESLRKLDRELRAVGGEAESARQMIELMYQQSQRSSPDEIRVHSVNLHTLMNRCLNQVLEETKKYFPDLSITVNKTFDSTVKMVPTLSEDLAYAFILLFNQATTSLSQKNEHLGHISSYQPTLSIRTIRYQDRIEIVIHDNGEGVAPQELEIAFEPLVDFNKQVVDLGYLILHDIIVQTHQWKMRTYSKKGEFLEVTLTIQCSAP